MGTSHKAKKYAPNQIRHELAKSFPAFLEYHLKLEGYQIGDVQVDMARALQTPGREKVLIGYRGISKTTIAKNYVAWRWLRNPKLKVKIISDCLLHAQAMTKDILNLLRNSPVMAPYAPKTTRLSRTNFNLDLIPSEKDASLSCIGVDGSTVSSRSDLLLFDDCESVDNSVTVPLREHLLWQIQAHAATLHPAGRHLRYPDGNVFMSKEDAIRCVQNLPESCQVIWIGTYQHEHSILLPTTDSEHPLFTAKRYLFPAMVLDPEGEVFAGFEGRWRATFPTRLTLSELRERCRSKARFCLDYLCDVQHISQEEQIVKIEKIPVKVLSPKWLYGFCEPSHGGNDETAVAFGAPVGNELYVEGMRAWKCDSPTWARELVEMCKSKGVVELSVEGQAPSLVHNVQGEIARQQARIVLRSKTEKRNKQMRMVAALDLLNGGRIVFNPSVLQDNRTLHQLTQLRRGQKLEPNDRADALTMLIDGFASFLAYPGDSQGASSVRL